MLGFFEPKSREIFEDEIVVFVLIGTTKIGKQTSVLVKVGGHLATTKILPQQFGQNNAIKFGQLLI